MKITRLLFVTLSALLFLVITWSSTTALDEPISSLEVLALNPQDFAAGTRQDTLISDDGLSLAAGANTGSYLSPILEAPVSFNAIVPSWLAEIPATASISLRIRTGTENGWWSEWYPIPQNDDWIIAGNPEIVGEMIAIPAADETHQKIQYAVSLSRYPDDSSPILQQVNLTFINTTNGPSADELLSSQLEMDQMQSESSTESYPKPFVISRDIWCTDARCDYTEGLEYHPVTHLIVHHTVSSNGSADWAAVVRAIWLYHYSIGWGDIGYNYLVDMNGVLYEGHLGGDNVIGIHAADANTGSMALAFIGTFTSPNYPNNPGITPPQAMKDSAAELFAWKADQNGIDVYGSSTMPKADWILPHLMGHRDVYGTTQCPGDQAYAILPWLRDQVTQRINALAPTIYIDELSGDFSMSQAGHWYEPPDDCGYGGHAFYTWSVLDPAKSTNWGRWQLNIPTEDNYDIEVFAPYCITGRSETDGATYQLTYGGGTSVVTVSHEQNVGSWMSLGTFHLQAGQSGSIYLTDLTSTESGLGVWFDNIRLRPSTSPPMPSTANNLPSVNTWFHSRSVSFDWSISTPSRVSKTTLQIARDGQFKDIIFSKAFIGAATTFNHTFPQDYTRLYWRIELQTVDGKLAYSAPTYFGIDTVKPSSLVTIVGKFDEGDYVIGWQGLDETSGIAKYNVDFREVGASWQPLLTDTTLNSVIFSEEPLKDYEFRSQAIDRSGHIEPLHSSADISTRDAVILKRAIIFPLILR